MGRKSKKGFKGAADPEWPDMDKVARAQRGRDGFSETDLWNTNTYLAIVLARMIEKNRAYGHPMGLTPEEWDSMLVNARQAWEKYIDVEYDVDYKRLQEVVEEALDSLKPIFLGLWD